MSKTLNEQFEGWYADPPRHPAWMSSKEREHEAFLAGATAERKTTLETIDRLAVAHGGGAVDSFAKDLVRSIRQREGGQGGRHGE